MGASFTGGVRVKGRTRIRMKVRLGVAAAVRVVVMVMVRAGVWVEDVGSHPNPTRIPTPTCTSPPTTLTICYQVTSALRPWLGLGL